MEAKYLMFVLLTLPFTLVSQADSQVIFDITKYGATSKSDISQVYFLVSQADSQVIFDITKYGATSKSDISQALLNAWQDAKASESPSRIVIPAGTWTLSQAVLEGPNSAPLELQLQGTIVATSDLGLSKNTNKEPAWIAVNHLDCFTLSGGGTLDGQGINAWKKNNCHDKLNCKQFPINLSLNFINNGEIRDVTSKDSKFFHIVCDRCTNVNFTRVTVSAPANSANTDGIHLARSKMINIADSTIGTGDDCISMGNDLSQVNIRGVTCGPGHGVSIGSLGKTSNEKDVSGIYVTNCTFIGTKNGARIKTWPSTPGTLQVSDIHFDDLIMQNVANPIIIDQQYCPSGLCDPSKPSLVQISRVTFSNVRGSYKSKEAVTLKCSSSKPCSDVRLSDIRLSYGSDGYKDAVAKATSICANIKPILSGVQIPPICAP